MALGSCCAGMGVAAQSPTWLHSSCLRVAGSGGHDLFDQLLAHPVMSSSGEPDQEAEQPAWDAWTVRAVSRGWRDVFDGVIGGVQVNGGPPARCFGGCCAGT